MRTATTRESRSRSQRRTVSKPGEARRHTRFQYVVSHSILHKCILIWLPSVFDLPPQSLKSGHHRFVRILWVGCSPGWTQILTYSWTSQRSRASIWTGTSRAQTRSSNLVMQMRTNLSRAPSGARASRGTQVRAHPHLSYCHV